MRMRWLLVALLSCAQSALLYEGAECEGFIDFLLADDTPVAQIEQSVASVMSSWRVPMWLAQRCKLQIRRTTCLSSYSSHAEAGAMSVCASVCEDKHSEDGCKAAFEFLKQIVSSSTFVVDPIGMESDCAAMPTQNCTAGGDSYAYFAADKAICPEPLHPIHPDISDKSQLVEPSLLGLTDCNAACPSKIYVSAQWDTLVGGVQVAAWISLVASVLVSVLQSCGPEKLQKLSALPATTCLLSSVAMVMLIVEGHDNVYCDDGVYVVENDDACIAQAGLTLFCATATAAIVACQAHNTYSRLEKTNRKQAGHCQNIVYGLLIVAVPAIYVLFMHCDHWLGFDKKLELPLCLMRRVGGGSGDFPLDLRLYAPQLIALLACVAMLASMIGRHIAFVVATRAPNSRVAEIVLQARTTSSRQSSGSSRPTSLRVTFNRMMRHDMQSSIFMAIYGTACVALLAVAVLFGNARESADGHASKWFECILSHTILIREEGAGTEACGDRPRHIPHLALPGFIALFYGAPGILLAIAYLPVAYKSCIQICRMKPESENSRGSSRHIQTPSSGNTMICQISNHSFPHAMRNSTTQLTGQPEELQNAVSLSVSMEPSPQHMNSAADGLSKLPTPPVKKRTPRRGANFRHSEPREFSEGDKVIVGTTIAGTVSGYLGEGKFGGSFLVLVTNQTASKQYIVKCARLPPDSTGSGVIQPAAAVKAYCDQLYVALRCSPHANVLNLYRVCKDGSPSAPSNRVLMFYDVIEGCDLYSFLQRRRSVWFGSDRRIQEVQIQLFGLSYQLVNALIWIHAREVLHCNVQPANIMVDPTGQELLITGFDLANVASRLDEHGQPVCTYKGGPVVYRSPEIACADDEESMEVCPRTSDLWGAALVILQMYCGGNCIWHEHFPRVLPGEHGVRAMACYDAVEKDRLFKEPVEFFADLTEFHGMLPTALVDALSGCSIASAIPDPTVRLLFSTSLHDESMLDDLRTHYNLNMSDVLRLRRIERQIFVLSMPPPLQAVLQAALNPEVEDRPASAEEWQQRLLGQHQSTSQEALDDVLVEVIHRSENVVWPKLPSQERASSLVNLGNIFHDLGESSCAVKCFEDAMTAHDGAVPVPALHRLAKCYLSEGDTERGSAVLERAVAADDTFGRAHYELAKLARDNGNLGQMMHHLRRCVEADVTFDHAKPRWMLGRLLRLTGAVEEASAIYDDCINECFGFAPAEAYLALQHYLEGNKASALERAESACELDDQNIVSSYLLGKLYQLQHNPVLSRELFEVAQSASKGWCHISMGDLFWAYGALSEAITCFEQAVRQFPNNSALVARLEELSNMSVATFSAPSVSDIVAQVSSHDGPNLVY